MKLSVITINRNNAQGLRRTIESVLAQTYTDFEYIVVDGASTDDSTLIIQSFDYSNLFSFTWISEPDRGIFNAMNKGITIAKGEYLLFLNSGDLFVEKEVLVKCFCKPSSADFICARCAVTDNGVVIHTTQPPQIHTLAFYFNTTLPHQSTFIKRYTFEKYGQYREDFKYISDWEFWIRTIILNNCTTQSSDIIVAEYNLDGISSDENNRVLMNREKDIVFSNSLLCKIIPDYDNWRKEKESYSVLFWVKSKPILYNFLILLYKFAVGLNKLKKQ